jgi:hypothetical protein
MVSFQGGCVDEIHVGISSNSNNDYFTDINQVRERWLTRLDLKQYQLDVYRTFQWFHQSAAAPPENETGSLLPQENNTSTTTIADSNLCLRGMEPLFNRAERQHRKRNSIQAVMKVQSLQRVLKQHDSEALANIYHSYTQSSANKAIGIAIQDQRDAWDCQDDKNENVKCNISPIGNSAARGTAAAPQSQVLRAQIVSLDDVREGECRQHE